VTRLLLDEIESTFMHSPPLPASPCSALIAPDAALCVARPAFRSTGIDGSQRAACFRPEGGDTTVW
jgi:hypothetical protein